MIYTKPQVEIVKFDNKSFIATSGGYASASDYLKSIEGVSWNGNTNSPFSCSSFGCTSPFSPAPGITFVSQNKNKWKIQQ